MISNKILYVVIAAVVVAVAIYVFTKQSSTIKEGFGSFSLAVKPQVVSMQMDGPSKGTFYSTPGFQAVPPPRFDSNGYGAYINYKMPPRDMQGVPVDPISQGNISGSATIKEKFSCGCGSGCSESSCPSPQYVPGPVTKPNYVAGNYNELADQIYKNSEYPEVSSMLPVGDMTSTDALGDSVQTVTFNNFTYANPKSRLRALGDKIRGDIPICDKDGRLTGTLWRPAVNVALDLEPGALAVMAGPNNDTNNELIAYMAASSGGAQTLFGGVDMTSQLKTELGAGFTDVNVTSFP